MQDRRPRRRRALKLAITGALLAPAALSVGCTEEREPISVNPGPDEDLVEPPRTNSGAVSPDGVAEPDEAPGAGEPAEGDEPAPGK
ncbi:MAG: hypothetical protein R3F62_18150 [Planctomycetota bacterium]